MYRQIQASRRANEIRRGIIGEVNPAKNHIQVQLATGEYLLLTFADLDPVVAIPAPGEMWTVTRRENDWFLHKRIEKGTEQTSVSQLVAGDRRLEATNKLYLNGNAVIINGQDFDLLVTKIAELEQRIIDLENA